MGAILKVASNIVGGITKTRPAKALAKSYNKDMATALAATTVASIIIKDGVGCYKYVTQSLKNDKIPEEKRKFVAALDLTNGVLMIAAQIAMFFAVRKYSGEMFNKLFKNVFNEKNANEFITRIRMNAKKAGTEIPKKLRVQDDYNKLREGASGAFKFIVDIAAATIVGKRMIVPLIATPLAKVVQGKMEGKKTPTVQNDTNEIKETQSQDKKEVGQNLDITMTSESTNLLESYKKYYGLVK